MEDEITFGCFFFLSSLLLFFGSQPGTNGVGTGFYYLGSQSGGGGFSPVRQIRPKVAIELYRLVVRLIGLYNCIRRMIISFFVSLPFLSLILALAAQEVCAEREG